VVDRTAQGGFVGGLHRSHHQHAAGFGWLEKRKQQLLLLLDRQILAMTAARRLAPQDRFPWAKIVRMQLPHRTHLPAQRRGNLCRSQTQGSTSPHALNPLVLCLVLGFFHEHGPTLGRSFRPWLWSSHTGTLLIRTVYCCS
jgi:hypothetical protein